MKIDQDILDIINSGNIEGNTYFLPDVQLERSTYMKVNKVLTILGGKWNRKAKGHIFATGIPDVMVTKIPDEIVDKKKELQFFETPEKISQLLCDLVPIEQAKSVLEPSAGRGAILKIIKKRNIDINIFWCEIDMDNSIEILDNITCHGIYGKSLGYDFMKIGSYDYHKVDCVVMNPPFTKQQDIDHVVHALKFLNPGGTLVAVMSPAIKFRTNKKTKEFLALIENYDYEIIDLPEGSFKKSGTIVNTIILKIKT